MNSTIGTHNLASAFTEQRWKRAFEKLEQEDRDFLSKESDSDNSSNWSSEQVANAVKKKIDQHYAKGLKIRLGGRPIRFREVGEKLMRFVLCFKDVIAAGCNTSPYASLAWSGVITILDILGSPTEQNEAMSKGLLKVAEILKLYRVRDELYLSGSKKMNDSLRAFEEAVVELYSATLEYQARMIKHLSHGSLHRFGSSVAKTFAWQDWVSRIEDLDRNNSQYRDLLDKSTEEERLSRIMSRMELSTDIQQQLLDWQKSIAQEQRNVRREKEEKQLLQSFVSAYEADKDTRQEATEGTRAWFLEVPAFDKWRNETQSSLLWISAGPGCGKSVLCRFLIDGHHLRTSIMSSHVSYFFFRDGQEGFSDATSALRAILHQILSTHFEIRLIDYALEHFRSYGDQLRNDFDRLWDILVAISRDARSGQIICALDALDECKPASRDKLLNKLVNFYRYPPNKEGKLKFIITSRRYESIMFNFKLLDSIDDNIEIDCNQYSEQIAQDIDKVLEQEAKTLFSSQNVKNREKVLDRLRKAENRTYLWLYLVLDSLQAYRYSPFSKIEQHIQSLPQSVDEAYERILERRDGTGDRDIAIQVLALVVAAARPLTPQELNIAQALRYVSVETFVGEDDIEELWDNERVRETVEGICGLLIQVLDGKVYLLHNTVREFLLKNERQSTQQYNWKGAVEVTEATEGLAEASIKCLYLTDSSRSSCKDMVQPFVRYARQHWAEHTRCAGLEWQQATLLQQASLCGEMRFTWVQPSKSDLESDWESDSKSEEYQLDIDGLASFPPIAIAAKFGLRLVLEYQIDQGMNINGHPSESHPLTLAVEEGHYEIIRTLIDKSADVNAQGGYYGNALQTASAKGYVRIVQILLNNGANVNAQVGYYGNALQAASAKDYVEIGQILLNRGANVNAQGGSYGNALQTASAKGYVRLVQILLNNGANVNAKGGYYGNALQAASAKSYVKIVQILLNHGANVNTKGGYYGTALQAASGVGNSAEIVKILLINGADINAQEGRYGNALQTALAQRRDEIAQILLDNGADINAQGGYLGNALQAASTIGGSVEIVQTLLDKGADINAQGGLYGTALQAASAQARIEIVQMLLDNGADVNVKGGKYGNALQAASAVGGSAEIVQILLDNGADVNAQGGYYGTALQAASTMGISVEIVQILLDRGANVNIQGGFYGNALQAASAKAQIETVQMLLDNGADVNVKGGKWDYALRAAMEEGTQEVVGMLLQRGATDGARDWKRYCVQDDEFSV